MSWLPLESNPEVLNPFVRRLGLPDGWEFCDVFGLDDELLMMVPQPCAALCLLYPSGNISKPRREGFAEEEFRKKQPPLPPNLFFCKQFDDIGNACGTLACMHAVGNAALANNFELAQDSPLSKFITANNGSDPSARGRALLDAKELQQMSDATAAAGETEGAGTDDAQNQHFISFVNFEGKLYELDGRNILPEDGQPALPVFHGETTAETFLIDAARVIKEQFMARDPTNVNFNVVALSNISAP